MNQDFNIKQQILQHLFVLTDKRIESIKQSIQLAKESRDNETKSSVGDKYETGRAMVQFEIEKYQVQAVKAENQKNDLAKIDCQKNFNKVEFGSLVYTTQGNYFISIAFGKIVVNEIEFFCLSLASPIGKLLHTKTTGDKINFQQKEVILEKII